MTAVISFDPRAAELARPGETLDRLASGATWSEGPVWMHEDMLRFVETEAFPVQRVIEPNNFVASVVQANDVLKQECPVKCRPKDHKDWKYC